MPDDCSVKRGRFGRTCVDLMSTTTDPGWEGKRVTRHRVQLMVFLTIRGRQLMQLRTFGELPIKRQGPLSFILVTGDETHVEV